MAWKRSSPMLQQAALALVAALAMAATCAEAGRDYGAGQSKFTITGTVLCQDCTKNWNAYAYNAKPIPGSGVAVTCLEKGKVAFYGKDETNKEGVFSVEVPYEPAGSGAGCRLDPSECLVRLVASEDKGCSVLTNFNGGRSGQRPFRPSKVCPTEVVYNVGPYYATLPQCDVDDKKTDAHLDRWRG
ncbi:pistil-specific extensin-like protein [Brachypodium distachyon]|uniref:Pollen Ole e 1 allergen and extensin family protein n=1 Tax=Brachypodium distachyon TaxID=15368 RepID=I1I5X0_BRADI|nr:pistil-specific extensin-like protein [Brachypodium distachyon]KQJ97687.1 hypothetical protein BRADI_3g32620v3 [Brachypodium distachyon]|eukprot:XP_003572040.1 pistil-specific extensin-like protein [Brachypodium distachyon]